MSSLTDKLSNHIFEIEILKEGSNKGPIKFMGPVLNKLLFV